MKPAKAGGEAGDVANADGGVEKREKRDPGVVPSCGVSTLRPGCTAGVTWLCGVLRVRRPRVLASAADAALRWAVTPKRLGCTPIAGESTGDACLATGGETKSRGRSRSGLSNPLSLGEVSGARTTPALRVTAVPVPAASRVSTGVARWGAAGGGDLGMLFLPGPDGVVADRSLAALAARRLDPAMLGCGAVAVPRVSDAAPGPPATCMTAVSPVLVSGLTTASAPPIRSKSAGLAFAMASRFSVVAAPTPASDPSPADGWAGATAGDKCGASPGARPGADSARVWGWEAERTDAGTRAASRSNTPWPAVKRKPLPAPARSLSLITDSAPPSSPWLYNGFSYPALSPLFLTLARLAALASRAETELASGPTEIEPPALALTPKTLFRLGSSLILSQRLGSGALTILSRIMCDFHARGGFVPPGFSTCCVCLGPP
jgi:hypothetical protein